MLVDREGIANRLFVLHERIRQGLELEAVDRDDAVAFAREVMRERVARGPEADDEHVAPVVRLRVRPLDVQRIEALEEQVDLETVREREHLGEHARLDLGDVDRLLLLEDARLHAAVSYTHLTLPTSDLV